MNLAELVDRLEAACSRLRKPLRKAVRIRFMRWMKRKGI